MVIQQFCIKSVDIHLSSVKVNEIKAQSKYTLRGGLASREAELISAPMVNKHLVGLNGYKVDPRIFIGRVTTLIQRTPSIV